MRKDGRSPSHLFPILLAARALPSIVASFSYPPLPRLFPALQTVGDEEEIKEKAVSRGSNKEALLVDETGEGNEYFVFEHYISGFENFYYFLIGNLGRILGFGTCFL